MPTLPAFHARIRPGTPSVESGRNTSGSRNRSSIAAVDHVHALAPVDRAHVDAVVVADDEVGALDELGAHPLGEERVLEVGASCRCPGVSTTSVRVGDAVGGERRPACRLQLVGVAVDRAGCSAAANSSANARLEIGAVLQHVAHARRHAQVVLEHVHRAVVVADEVAAADVRPHAELRRARRGTAAGS